MSTLALRHAQSLVIIPRGVPEGQSKLGAGKSIFLRAAFDVEVFRQNGVNVARTM